MYLVRKVIVTDGVVFVDGIVGLDQGVRSEEEDHSDVIHSWVPVSLVVRFLYIL